MSEVRRADVLILGGGAAGMAAAITLAGRLRAAGRQDTVVLAEKLAKPGKKLLATGNGRCNLGNAGASAAGYKSSSSRQLEAVMAQLPPKRLAEFWARQGLLCAQEEGRIYPYSRFAGTVLELLQARLEELGVEQVCDFAAARAEKTAAGFAVLDKDGNGFEAGLLLLAAGGCAAPALGTDGSGFALARGLGHKVEEPWPALVSFVSGSPLCKGLKGLRAEGKLTLCRNGRVLAEEMGEVQFTEYGLSGIPAFQLSLAYGAARCRGQEGAELRVDFFPEKSRESLVRLLEGRLERARTAEDLLMGTLHWKLTQAVLKTAGVKGQSPARPEQLAPIADAMKAMAFPVSGTLGWEQAQAGGGGVSLEEVDAHTLASRPCPGLYLAGEVLDAVGLCGGYNLHWAFGTGILAGEGMAAALLGPAAPAQKAAPQKERKPRREKPKAPAKGKPAKKRK